MVYRRTAATERKIEETRECILDVARRLVSRSGWAGATIAGIAEGASIATGSIYLHFETKAALFAEVFENIASRELSVIAALGRGAGAPELRLQHVISVFARRALRGRRQAYAVIAEPSSGAIEALRLVSHRRFVDEFAHVIAEGVATRAFEPQDPRISAACLFGGMVETLVGPLAPMAGDLPDGGDALVDELLRFAMRAVGAADREVAVSPVQNRRRMPSCST